MGVGRGPIKSLDLGPSFFPIENMFVPDASGEVDDSDKFYYMYTTDELQITYICLVHVNYKKKFAKSFLKKLKKEFRNILKETTVETGEHPEETTALL